MNCSPFYGVDQTMVGYPISLCLYGNNRGKVYAKKIALVDSKGNSILFL